MPRLFFGSLLQVCGVQLGEALCIEPALPPTTLSLATRSPLRPGGTRRLNDLVRPRGGRTATTRLPCTDGMPRDPSEVAPKGVLLPFFERRLVQSIEERAMTRVEQLEEQIQQLSPAEFAELRTWLAERDWEEWDKQIEQDAASGKLDRLFAEAREAHQQGKSTKF